MTENKNRCVITGLGMICAIGNSVEETWENALKGTCGIKEVKSVSSEGCYANLAAEVDCDALDSLPKANEMDRASKLCVKAAGEAIGDAKIDLSKDNATRVSVIMGSCVGGVVSVEDYYANGKPAANIPKMPISAIANQVAEIYGAGGVVTNIGNACAAGTISVSYACDLIRQGISDVVLAGGSDAFASVPYAGFLSLSALDTSPCAPFNHCHGITLGEGSGVLVVESYEHAMARGAKIYCEVLGSGVTTDAHHITAPREDGMCQMIAINRAIEHSGLNASDIGYVNAHGTGTAKNDNAEFLSLHTIFDDKNDNLSVSSTKAMVGHCLGAAGAIEAVFAVKALTENEIPATIGYNDEDLEVLKEKAGKIDFMPNDSKKKELTNVMSNSFAFGGNNASIIFSKEAGDVKAPVNEDKLLITGAGIVSTVGNTVEDYIKAVKENEAPESESVTSEVGSDDFKALDVKMAFYRKLDKFSQLQAVSGIAAIKNANLEVTDDNAADIGIVVGTADGPLTTVCNFQMDLTEKGNSAGSAFKFPNTVYNAAGGYLSINSGIKGYNVTVTNGTQSGLQGIAYAMQILRQDRAKVMLATGTDENSEVMTEFYEKLSLIGKDASEAYTDESGFTLSDGSTSMVIETATSAKERGAEVLAEVAGFGMAHKSVSFGKLSGSGEALDEAIKLACKDAKIELSDIDGIVGFGGGLAAIDKLELDSYRRVFGEVKPVIAIKNITGEGRAATATLQAVHAALTLSGKLGDEQKAYEVTANGAEKKTVNTSAMKNLLVTSYGAGGSYTALIVRK